MSEKISMVLFMACTMFLLLVIQTLTTRISRRNIVLGVKVPEEKIKTKGVQHIIQGFIRENMSVGIGTLVLISFLIYLINTEVFFALSIFIYIGILFLVYLKWNKKMKALKKEEAWTQTGKRILTVDTGYSKDRGLPNMVSRKWFLIPVALILISTLLTFIKYPTLPNRIPTHWDFNGNVDGYMTKSILVALFMPLTQVFIGLVFYFSYYGVVHSKQQTHSTDSHLSLKKNRLFKRAWSIYFIVTLTILELLFTWSNMISLGIASNMTLLVYIEYAVFALIVISSIVLSIKMGQGGDRLNLSEEKEGSRIETDYDDDNLWKLGNTIYYNPADPSVFVEKRVGIGWTMNAGRPIGMVLMVFPILIVILSFYFSR